MSENAVAGSIARTKVAVSLFVGFALLLLLIANGHLIYVATTSQPACVAHVQQGEGIARPGRYSAAQSACSPL